MAILNATTMERERINLGWSVTVQKCQQIFETVAARHGSTLHDCLRKHGIAALSLGYSAEYLSANEASSAGRLVPIKHKAHE
jgi:hypothetical protein